MTHRGLLGLVELALNSVSCGHTEDGGGGGGGGFIQSMSGRANESCVGASGNQAQ